MPEAGLKHFWSVQRPSTARDLLDSFAMPLVLMDARRKVLHANPCAVRLLDEADFIYLEDKQLACRDPENQVKLAAAVQALFGEAATNGEKAERRHVLHLKQSDGSAVPSVLRLLRRSSMGDAASSHHALFAIVEPREELPEARLIASTFRLTAAEARLAAMISAGHSPAECARALNVKISTVRSQLASIFRKTGASSQAHLVRLILALTLL